MTDVKLLSDEHVPSSFTQQLRKSGIDIVSVEDIGLRGADDETVIQRAEEEGRALVTFDKDYLGDLADRHTHPGILAFTRPVTIGKMIQEIRRVINHIPPESLKNHIQYLPWETKK